MTVEAALVAARSRLRAPTRGAPTVGGGNTNLSEQAFHNARSHWFQIGCQHRREPQAEFYGWSEDKARQYAEPLRGNFGAFLRAKGFCLD